MESAPWARAEPRTASVCTPGTASDHSPAGKQPITRLETQQPPTAGSQLPLQQGKTSPHSSCHRYQRICCQVCSEILQHRTNNALMTPGLCICLTQSIHGCFNCDSQACSVGRAGNDASVKFNGVVRKVKADNKTKNIFKQNRNWLLARSRFQPCPWMDVLREKISCS